MGVANLGKERREYGSLIDEMQMYVGALCLSFVGMKGATYMSTYIKALPFTSIPLNVVLLNLLDHLRALRMIPQLYKCGISPSACLR